MTSETREYRVTIQGDSIAIVYLTKRIKKMWVAGKRVPSGIETKVTSVRREA
jgi:hypothetical protein